MTVDICDKLRVDLIVRRERSRSVAFRDNPSVLGRNELEGSVNEITEAGRSSKNEEIQVTKGRTCLTGHCCSLPPDAHYHLIAHPTYESNSHSHPKRTWHLRFLDEWTINNTSIQMEGCQFPLQQGQTLHDYDFLRICRLRNSDILKNRQSVRFIVANFRANP
jgi:hypothetical protein